MPQHQRFAIVQELVGIELQDPISSVLDTSVQQSRAVFGIIPAEVGIPARILEDFQHQRLLLQELCRTVCAAVVQGNHAVGEARHTAEIGRQLILAVPDRQNNDDSIVVRSSFGHPRSTLYLGSNNRSGRSEERRSRVSSSSLARLQLNVNQST